MLERRERSRNGKRPGFARAARPLAKAPDTAVRERLLSAAIKLFSRKGYAATTTREMVDSAGVTKPVLYYYFKSKEGIYLELIGPVIAQFSALLDASRDTPGRGSEKILQLCARVFTLFIENVDTVRLIYAMYYGPPQGAPFIDFDAIYFKFYDTLRQMVEEGVRKKEFRKGNPQEMTWTVLGALNIVIETDLCHPERALGQQGLHHILALVFRGISTK